MSTIADAKPAATKPFMMEPDGTFRTWDVHTHSTAPGDTPGEILKNLLRHADRAGIDQVCIHRGVPDCSFGFQRAKLTGATISA